VVLEVQGIPYKKLLNSNIINKLAILLVFLIFLSILYEYRQSNELRRQILVQVTEFNTQLNTFILTANIHRRKESLELAAMMWGANISLRERDDSNGIYSRE